MLLIFRFVWVNRKNFSKESEKKLKSMVEKNAPFISYECTNFCMRHTASQRHFMNMNFQRINFSHSTALCNWLLQCWESRKSYFFRNSKETRHEHTWTMLALRRRKRGAFFLVMRFPKLSPKNNIFRLFSNYHT